MQSSRRQMDISRILHDIYYNKKNDAIARGDDAIHSLPADARKIKAIIDKQRRSSIYKLRTSKKARDDVITLRDIKKWLQSQDFYTLHKPIIKNFKRNHYYVLGIDHLWEIDLTDLSMFESENDNYRYLLTVIDVFSKYAWVKCVKNKNARTITSAFRKILDNDNKNNGRKPITVQCDRGREFKNSIFKNFLSARNIKLQFPLTTSKFKCAHIEVFNKTLKQRMFRYFTYKGEGYRRYIDVLQSLVDGYNNTIHSTIKMKPADVREHHTPMIYANTHAKHSREISRRPQIQQGDFVRVIKKKPVFEHGYTESWTREIFIVKDVIQKAPYTLFKLKDRKGSDVAGKFYEQELQRVNITTQQQ